MDDQDKLLQQKINALMAFVIVSPTGEVDNNASYKNFAQVLHEYATNYNGLLDAIRPSVQEILEADSTRFVSMDDLKYATRRNLEEKDIHISSEEMNGLLQNLIKSKFMIARRGRSGGIQLFDNALSITVRSMAKDQEITDELRAQVKQKLLKEEESE